MSIIYLCTFDSFYGEANFGQIKKCLQKERNFRCNFTPRLFTRDTIYSINNVSSFLIAHMNIEDGS